MCQAQGCTYGQEAPHLVVGTDHSEDMDGEQPGRWIKVMPSFT